MLQNMFDRNIFIYLMLGFGGFGILVKMVVNFIYKKLIQASDNMAGSNNKLMKLMRLKFEACYKLKIGVNNVDIFVDKYVYKHKFCGIHLYTWENIGGQILMICMLIATVGAGLGLLYERGKTDVLLTFFVGIVCSFMLITFESLINLSAKRNLVRVNIKDYLENFLKVRLEQEYFNPEVLEAYRNEYFTHGAEEVAPKKAEVEQPEKVEIETGPNGIAKLEPQEIKMLMDSLVHTAASRTEEGKGKKNKKKPSKKTESEEEKIIEDILKEYMA